MSKIGLIAQPFHAVLLSEVSLVHVLLETILLIDAVPDLPGLWASVAREALWVQQQVHILGVG